MTVHSSLNPPEIPDERAVQRNRLTAVTGSQTTGPGPSADLAVRLFDGPERWGWEYVEPRPIAPYPHLDSYPQWSEPTPPDISEYRRKIAVAKAKLLKRLGVAGVLLLVGLGGMGSSVGVGTVVVLAAMGVATWAGAAILLPQSKIREVQEGAKRRRDAVYGDYRAVTARWDEQVRLFDEAEQRRYATDPLLYPLAASSVAGRIDAFGGTPDGWAALLATAGSSMLATGSTVLVLDLSGRNVAAPLLELTRAVGRPAQTATVPAALDQSWLLGDLPPRELADVLAEAMDAQRGRGGAADLGSMDAELIHTVARRLDAPVTFSRLAAGIRVLRSTYEPDEDHALSSAEVSALTERIDLIDRSERMRDELGFVESQLKILADSERTAVEEAPAATASSLWPFHGLGLIRSDEHNPRRKTFVDRVLFAAVAHALSTTRLGCDAPTLVVAGADELGRPGLESMARAASKARVRLVYLFEHLRDDAADLLGGGDSVTVLMRIGNGREAQTAAEYIGRGYQFRLSQLSRQVGTTVTTGTSSSWTETVGGSESLTEGRSASSNHGGSAGGGHSGSNWGRSFSDNWSRTLTDTWSTSKQAGESFSEGRSDTDGAVLQRSYEFTVEPIQIQTLDPTTFLLVDSGPQGRRVRMADCFPGSVYVPRRNPQPRP